MLGDPVRYFEQRYRTLAEAAGHSWDTALDRSLATTYLIVKRWLPRLLHNSDIHAMHWSLEARVPFADVTLLELARQVHPHVALQHGTEKWLLRQAIRGWVPEAVRLRKKSALPKDQNVAACYQREALTAVAACGDFLGTFLHVPRAAALATQTHTLTEAERALLFRIVCLSHWRRAYGVEI